VVAVEPAGVAGSLVGALELLAEAPAIGRRHSHPDIPGLRRLLLPGTRYHIYYVHEAERDAMVILAIWSAVRGRGPALVR
jgi:plasmid stabilization system protein ParE